MKHHPLADCIQSNDAVFAALFNSPHIVGPRVEAPVVKQLLFSDSVNPAKFTKTGLDNAYYKYLTEKLNKVRT